jgi:hypothetical protein
MIKKILNVIPVLLRIYKLWKKRKYTKATVKLKKAIEDLVESYSQIDLDDTDSRWILNEMDYWVRSGLMSQDYIKEQWLKGVNNE